MESPTGKLESLYSIRYEQIKKNNTINYGHSPTTAPRIFLREKNEVSPPLPLTKATSDTLHKKTIKTRRRSSLHIKEIPYMQQNNTKQQDSKNEKFKKKKVATIHHLRVKELSNTNMVNLDHRLPPPSQMPPPREP